MLYHLIVHVSRNINGFWAMCDLSEASVSYVLYDARVRAPLRATRRRRERGDRARDSTALPSLKRELFRCFTAYIA